MYLPFRMKYPWPLLITLKLRLLGSAKKNIASRHSENLEAYYLYLKGSYNYQLLTVEGLSKASEYFEQALQKILNMHLLLQDWDMLTG